MLKRGWLIFSLLLFSSVAVAEEPPRVWGTWQFEGDRNEVDAMEEQVDAAAQTVNFLIRPIARSRLLDECSPPGQISIELDGDQVVIGTAKRTIGSRLSKRRATKDGGWVERTLEKGVLIERLGNDKGVRENRFSVQNGKLQMETIISSDRLPKPIDFEYTFVRTGG